MTSSVLHTRLWQERGAIHPGILILDDVAVDAQYWSIRQFPELNEPNDVLNQVVAVPLAPPEYIHACRSAEGERPP